MNTKNIFLLRILTIFLIVFNSYLLSNNDVPYREKRDLSNELVICHPLDLVTSERFDIMAKYIYIKNFLKNVNSTWPKEIYAAHLKVWNGYNEYILPSKFEHFNCAKQYIEKHGINDYIKSFENLLIDIKKNGFDPNKSILPINSKMELMDGGHRLAIALALDIPVACKIFNYSMNSCSADYLKNKTNIVSTGLEEKYLDAMALEYVKLKKNTYIVSVFPSINNKNKKICEILNRFGTVIYQKNISLSHNGALNYIHILYKGESWVGNFSDNFKGLHKKTELCFPAGKGDIQVFLIEADNLKSTKKAKKEIRELFTVGNHSVHINDTYEETLRIAQVIFLENGIYWLNYSQLKNIPQLEQYLKQYKQRLKAKSMDNEDFCIGGSGTLAAYCLRDCRDLDFIHHGDEREVEDSLDQINNHNDELQYYSTNKDEIIFNPQNHFYYDGVKFAALHIVKAMKEKRKEAKDIVDIGLIGSILTT